MYFHVVKWYFFYKCILCKPAFGMDLKLFYHIVQPYGLWQIHLVARLFDGIKYLMCSCILRIVANHHILQKMIVLNDPHP